jgi:epoxyqueuosine reductase
LTHCPTGALLKPRRLDARRCISYLTIESKEEISPELENKMGGYLFGCDICQEICPYNQKALPTNLPEFQTHRTHMDIKELLSIDSDAFQKKYAGSSIFRADLARLQNLAARAEGTRTK